MKVCQTYLGKKKVNHSHIQQ